MELATLTELGIKVIIVIDNNHVLLADRASATSMGFDNPWVELPQTTDFVEAAAGFGVDGERVEKPEDIDAALQRALDHPGSYVDRDIERVVGVHLFGHPWKCRAAWPHMRRQGYGRLVGVSSSSSAAAQDAGLLPDDVAPTVARLAHESVPYRGKIIQSQAGAVNEVFLAMTEGHVGRDRRHRCDHEMVAKGGLPLDRLSLSDDGVPHVPARRDRGRPDGPHRLRGAFSRAGALAGRDDGDRREREADARTGGGER